MQEDFLQYIWKYKKFNPFNLKTTQNEQISIVSVGLHNHDSGPDFFNAQLKIGEQLWAGNVEVHINSNDWYLHNHEKDKTYDNVILHIVWEYDNDIYRKDNTCIPTLELKNYTSPETLNNYHKLFSKTPKWINCEKDFKNVDSFIVENWIERLYFERLERTSQDIKILLENSKNNWEAVLFKMLARSFGLKVNGDAFFSMANSFDFSILRKVQSKQLSVEALLYGQSNLLEDDFQEPYFTELKTEYEFLKQKFQLSNSAIIPIQFFRLRPLNFPTIRISQLASLYHRSQNLFSKIITTISIKEIYDIFSVEASEFWDTHYTFHTASKQRKKKLTKSFIDLLLINTIIPLKFSYAKYQGIEINDTIITLIQSIASENNTIINKFNSFKKISKTALDSQALLQLKNNYCDKNKCLQCVIGNTLLNRN
ncbi:DUF2851 family protein [Flavobacteriaceae bacterium AU392]|nr:DUF2851 family protein [Flavobacteriaceae bacterium]RKM81167.1 DUF2851 family protein [Flavobacteriaceae bacterium AU392]